MFPPKLTLFLSTPSARRATFITSVVLFSLSRFLSTPSARRATRDHRPDLRLRRAISIHALREEGDVSATSGEQTRSISIHALREEGDKYRLLSGTLTFKFLSTPSARRATTNSKSMV